MVITVVVTTGLWIGLGPGAALQTGGVLVLLTVALGLGRRRVDALRVAVAPVTSATATSTPGRWRPPRRCWRSSCPAGGS